MLPSVELAVKEGTALPVICQSRQVGIDAGYETGCAIRWMVDSPRPGLTLAVSVSFCFPTALFRLRECNYIM